MNRMSDYCPAHSSALIALAAIATAPAGTDAALVFQKDKPAFTANSVGTLPARVDIHLAQATDTTLSAGGGINPKPRLSRFVHLLG